MTIYNFIISSTYKIREVILNRPVFPSETLLCHFVNACIITVKKPPATHRFFKEKTNECHQSTLNKKYSKQTNQLFKNREKNDFAIFIRRD